MKEMICIVCPKGCHLQVDENGNTTGNQCVRGAQYAKSELLHPTRVLTSTVRICNGLHPRLPVKTDCPIPKADVFRAMSLLEGIELNVPVSCGQVVLRDILGTGANFIATRNMFPEEFYLERKKEPES